MRPTSAIALAILCSGCLVDRAAYEERRALLVDDDGDGWSENAGDCDDTEKSVHPANPDGCNGVDDDCDGSVDEEIDRTWYPDVDADGYGAAVGALAACEGPAEWALRGGDCDDADAAVHPDALELCDLVDDDCDGTVDEDLAVSPWYADADGDGFGDATRPIERCMAPEGYVALPADCDDADAGVNPDAREVCEDGVDDDCDGGSAGCTWEGTADTSAADARLLGDRAGTGVGVSLAVREVDGEVGDDLLVGSTAGQGAWLIAGDEGRLAGDTPVARAPLLSVRIDPSDYGPDFRLGTAVTLCDFDDDEIPDIVVTGYEPGAASGEPGGASRLFVFDGGSTGERTTADALYETMAFGDLQGASLGCHDVDGDGADDIVAGTPAYDSDDGEDVGALQVLYGGQPPEEAVGPVDEEEPALSATFGESAGAALGASLAPLDLGGDGDVDFLAGAGGQGGGASGLAWLLTGPLDEGAFTLDASERLLDATSGAQSASVAAGDLNGDGYDDMVVGAPQDASRGPGTGAVYVVSGDPLLAKGDACAFVEDATLAVLLGSAAGMELGSTVAVIPGDDGEPARLVVGAVLDDGGGVDAGAAYLWEGDALAGELTPSSATATWRGAAAGDGAGRAVATTGDLDGDGYFDLALGAPGVDDPASDAGAVYLFYGSGF